MASALQTPFDEAPLAPPLPATIDASLTEHTAHSDTNRTRDLIVVDVSIPNYSALLADLYAQGYGESMDIVLLNEADDGIAAITDLLSSRHNMTSVHIISDNHNETIPLGATQLNKATSAERLQELESWGKAIRADGELLFHGGNLAATAQGQLLLHAIANSCQCDVSAGTHTPDYSTRNSDHFDSSTATARDVASHSGNTRVNSFTASDISTHAEPEQAANLQQLASSEPTDDQQRADQPISLLNDPTTNAPVNLFVNSSTAGGLSINEDGGNNAYLLADDADAIFGGRNLLTIELELAIRPGGTASLIDYATAGQLNEFSVLIDNNGQLQLVIGGEAFTFSTPQLNLDDGIHRTIGVVWNGITGQLSMYLNGKLTSEISDVRTGYTIAGSGTLVIGNDLDAADGSVSISQYTSAELHRIRFFDTARTGSELQDNHQQSLPHNEPGLLAQWNFDKRSGDTITNTVAGNNLVISHTTQNGYISSSPELQLSVSELSPAGTLLGSVAGTDPERLNRITTLLASDASLIYDPNADIFYRPYAGEYDHNSSSLIALLTPLNGVSGELPTILSANENETIRQLISSTGQSAVWLSGSDSLQADNWRWVNGTQFWAGDASGSAVDNTYNNFAPLEPDGQTDTDITALFMDESGQWRDTAPTTTAVGLVLQWRADSVLDTTDKLTYSIVSQTRPGAFAINAENGEIRVADASLTHLTGADTRHTLLVRVTDSDNNVLEQLINVAVDDGLPANTAPNGISSGIQLNNDGGNNAYLVTTELGTVLEGLSEFTLETTVAVDTVPEAQATLISYATASGTNTLVFSITDEGRLRLAVNDTFSESRSAYPALFDGEAHHLAASWNNKTGQLNFYLEGELIDSINDIEVGYTVPGAGTLILGQHQETPGSGYSNANVFSGTYYDLRIWSQQRTEREIALSHGHLLDISGSEATSTGLLANWLMNGFSDSGEIIDRATEDAAPRHLSVGQVSGDGFAASTPNDTLHTTENAVSEISVGVVTPIDTNLYQDIVTDGLFLDPDDPGSRSLYLAGESLGNNWRVSSGSISLVGSYLDSSPLNGRSIDLNGLEPGTIIQQLATEAGKQYQLTFALTGDWSSLSDTKALNVTAALESAEYTIDYNPAQTPSNPLWEPRSFTFTAESSTTELAFSSLTAGNYGPIIADIQVTEVPAGIATLLANDPALIYNAATDKFYRPVDASLSWTQAAQLAYATTLNGVNGQFVTIESRAENNAIQTIALELTGPVWLGANDIQSEGNFYWLDGFENAAQFWSGGQNGSVSGDHYVNFVSGEPDNLNNQQHYLQLDHSTGKWQDYDLGQSAAYIVEWQATDVLSAYRYQLTDDADGRFSIGLSSGEVFRTVGANFDHETATSHDIEVEITNVTGDSYRQTLPIAVDNAFELAQTLAEPQTTPDHTAVTFSQENGNAITVTDTVANVDSRLQVHITTNFNGTLSLAQTTGLSIEGGSNHSTFMTIHGSESDINAALDGMVYTPATGFDGTATVTVSVSLGADLQGHYEFSERANDTSVGLTQHGTLRSGANTAFDTSREDVLLLNSNRERVEIQQRFGNPANVTLASWINLDAAISDAEIVSLGNNLALRADDTNHGLLLLYYQGSGNWSYVSAPEVDLDGTGWNHVAATFDDDNNRVSIFVNGELVATEFTDHAIDWVIDSNTDNSTVIGAHGTLSNAFEFKGKIDDVRIYDRALSADQLFALYQEDTSVSQSPSIDVQLINDAPTFNTTHGYAENRSLSQAFATDSAVDASGRTIVTGYSEQLAVARFNPDGSIDTTFGDHGSIEYDFGFNSVRGSSIAIQDNGQILVSGAFDNNANIDSFVARLNDDGSLDSQFASNGFSAIDFNGADNSDTAVAIQPDGKIILAGSTDNAATSGFSFARLNTDGTPDTEFGINGQVFISVASGDHAVHSVGLQVDGKIVYAGSASGNGAAFTVGRLHSSGVVDSSFASNGFAQHSFAAENGSANALIIQADGKIVVAGNGIGELAIARYNTDGTPDNSFGLDGLVTTNLGDSRQAVALALQADGKMVVAANGPDSANVLLRFNSDGTSDSSFGTGGFVRLLAPDGSSFFEVHSMDVINNDAIIVAGSNGDHFIVEKITAEGQHELSFGANSLGGQTSYIEDSNSVVLDNNVQIFDTELSAIDYFAGSTLTLSRATAANPDDLFLAATDGTLDTLQEGASLYVGASRIGFITKNSDGILELQFNSNASNALVNQALRQIAYQNASDNPVGNITLNWVFNDGGDSSVLQGDPGARQVTGTTTVSMTAVSNDPVTRAHYSTWIGAAEFIVNDHTNDNQHRADIAPLNDGGFVVVWESDNQAGGARDGIYFQRYDSSGYPIGTETRASANTLFDQGRPSITAIQNGGFAIAWQSSSDTERAVSMRVFDADGVPQSSDISANTEITGDQDTPDIISLINGDLVVAWESNGQDGSGDGVYFQRFDPNGIALGIETRINTNTVGEQDDVHLTATVDGGFLAAWEGTSTGSTEVYTQRYDASGSPVGTTLQVNSQLTGVQDDVRLATLTHGEFVAIWESENGQDGNHTGIYGQRLNSDGSLSGDEFQINSHVIDSQRDHNVTALPDGGFIVVWESIGDQDGDEGGIFAQQFDSSGLPVNGEFQINTTRDDNQSDPAISMLDNGTLVVVWESNSQDNSGKAVVGRIFQPALGEHAPAGSVVALVSQIDDADPNDTYSYALSDSAGGAFAIDSNTGTITLTDPTRINFESNSTLAVIVEVTDPVAGVHHETVTINLRNSPEAAHSLPATQAINEDNSLLFSAATGNAITVFDTLPNNNSALWVNLTVDEGTLSLPSDADITVLGDSNNTNSISISGNESAINNALDGLSFTPSDNFHGAVTLSITTTLATDLQGHYTFTAGSTNNQAADSAHASDLTGAATIITDIDRGEVLHLDGITAGLAIDSVFDEPESVTVAAWVSLQGKGSGGAEVIAIGGGAVLRLDDTGLGNRVVGYFNDGSELVATVSNQALLGAGWHHVAYTVDPNLQQQRLYIDGILVGQSRHAGSISYPAQPVTLIGHTANSDNHFNGFIDDLRIYSSALSDDSIAAIARQQTLVTDRVEITIDAVNDTPRFGNPGYAVLHSTAASVNQNNGTAILENGNILVTPLDDNLNSTIALLGRDGALDTRFANSGFFQGANLDLINTLVVQSDGKILAGGSSGGNLAVARYHTDGTLDTDFGTQGATGIELNGNDEAVELALQDDGKIIVAGRGNDQPVVLQLNADGSQNGSFSPPALGPFNSSGTFSDVQIQSDGRILLAAENSLTRLQANGSIDNSFDTDGVIDTAFTIRAVQIQADQKIVVTGQQDDDLIVARYHTDGRVDDTFGEFGSTIWSPPALSRAIGIDVAQQTDGHIIVAANIHYNLNPASHWAAIRFTADGVADASFANDGAWLMPENSEDSQASTIAVYEDDGAEKIIISGFLSAYSFSDSGFVRLNTDGSLDISAHSGQVNSNPAYSEGNTPTVLDSDVSIYDPDFIGVNTAYTNTILTLARDVSPNPDDHFSATGLLADLTEGAAVDYAGTDIGTVIVNSGGALVLSFNGNASAERISAAMSAIAYSNSSDAPPAEVLIKWNFSDGNSGAQGAGGSASASASSRVMISAVNDAPVLTGITLPSLVYVENTPPVEIAPNLTITDVDNSQLQSAIIRLSDNYQPGEDRLSFVNSGNITGTWNAANGELLLNGVDTLANYQTALRSITYHNTSELPDTRQRTVIITVDDGETLSAVASQLVNVTETIDPPEIVTNELFITRGETIGITSAQISATDADSSDDALVFVISQLTGGKFNNTHTGDFAITLFNQTQIANGHIVFVHDGSTTLPAYELTVFDNFPLSFSGPSSADITFSAVNSAPQLIDLSGDLASVYNNNIASRLDTGPLATLIDAEQPLHYDGASLSITGHHFQTQDALQLDTSGVFSLTPAATTGDYVVLYNAVAVAELSGYESSAINFRLNSSATANTVEALLHNLAFSTSSAVIGSRTIEFVFNDNGGTSDGGDETSPTATSLVRVLPFGAGTINTAEDTPYTFSLADFEFTGTAASRLQSVTITENPANGTLLVGGTPVDHSQTISAEQIRTGNFSYSPAADGNGSLYTSFTMFPNSGNSIVTLLAGEPGPQSLGGGALTGTDQIIAEANNFGINGTLSTTLAVAAASSHLDANYLSTGQILFIGAVDNAEWTNAELLAVRNWVQAGGILIASHDRLFAEYGLTTASDSGDHWVNAAPLHDIMNGPFGVVDESITVTGDNSAFSAGVLADDTVIAREPVSDQPSMLIRSDGAGAVLLVANDGIFHESLTGGGSIVTANDRLVANIFAWAANGVPASEFHTLSINVEAINDNPQNAGTFPATTTATEDTVTAIDLAALDLTDIDAGTEPLTLTFSTLASRLTATAADGIVIDGDDSQLVQVTGPIDRLNSWLNSAKLFYTGATDEYGSNADTIQVTINDNGNHGSGGGNAISLGAIAVNIDNINDAPSGTDNRLNVNEDNDLILRSVDFGFSDIADSDSFSAVTISTLPARGQLSLNGSLVAAGDTIPVTSINNNWLVFRPFNNENGIDYAQLTFLVNDNGGQLNGGQDQALSANTLSFDVNPVNDPPGGTDITLTTDEDTDLVFNSDNFGFRDSVDTHQFSGVKILTTPAAGALLLNNARIAVGDTITAAQIDAGQLLFRPAAEAHGSHYAAFDFAVQDNGTTSHGGIDTSRFANTVTIDVSEVPDSPVLDGIELSALRYTENESAIVSSTIRLTDPDSATINRAVIQMANHFIPAEDQLIFTNTPAITGQWDAVSGTLTLQGADTVANYQLALRSVIYQNTSDTPNTLPRTVSFTVNDQLSISNTAERQIIISAVNDPPLITANTLSISEGERLQLSPANIAATDAESLANDLRFSVSNVNGGRFERTANPGAAIVEFTQAQIDAGEILFVHNGRETAPAYQLLARDSQGAVSDSTPATVIFTGINDAPAGRDNTIAAVEDSDTIIKLTDFGFEDDTEPDSLQSVTFATVPTNGTLSLNGVALDAGDNVSATDIELNRLVYRPAYNANGENQDEALFRVVDDGDPNNGSNIDPTANRLQFDVEAVNDAPSGTDNTLTLSENTDYPFSLADFGYSDNVDGDAFTALTIDSLPIRGYLLLNGTPLERGDSISTGAIVSGQLLYRPDSGDSGTDYASFSFRVQDDGGTEHGGQAIDITARTITFNVSAVHLPPRGADSTVITHEDSNYVFGTADFGFDDGRDNDQFHAVIIDSVPTAGLLLLNGNAVSAGDRIDSTAISVGDLQFQPEPHASGTPYDSFTFRVQDDSVSTNANTDLISRRLTIDVDAVNDAPAGTDAILTTLEDTPYVFTAADFGFTDALDPDSQFQSIRVASLPAVGTLTLDGAAVAVGLQISAADIAANQLVYAAPENRHGNPLTAWDFQVQDSGGRDNGGIDTDPTPNTIDIQVLAVNDAPMGQTRTVVTAEDTPYTFATADFGFSDPADNNRFSGIEVTRLPASGTLLLDFLPLAPGQFVSAAQIDSGMLAYLPAQDSFGDGNNGLGFLVRDDGGTDHGGRDIASQEQFINFDVPGINDAPSLFTGTATFDEGSENILTTLMLNASDADNTPEQLIFTVTRVPANGQLLLNGIAMRIDETFSLQQLLDDQLRYQHDGSETVSDLIEVSLSDGGADGVQPLSGRFHMTINEVLDPAPQLTPDTVTLAFGQAFSSQAGDVVDSGSVTVLGNDLVSTGNYVVSIVAPPSHGTVTINADGTFSYRHDRSGILLDEFVYRVTNEDGIFSLSTVQIVIEPPVAAATPAQTADNQPSSPPNSSANEETEQNAEPEISRIEGQPGAEESVTPHSTTSEQQAPAQEQQSVLPVVELLQDSLSDSTDNALRERMALDVKQHKSNKALDYSASVLTDGQSSTEILFDILLPDSADIVGNPSFQHGLSNLENDLQTAKDESATSIQVGAGATFGVSISVTAGVLAWTLRGGSLLASLAAVTPVWTHLDPIAILSNPRKHRRDTADDDVEELFVKSADEPQSADTPHHTR